MIDQSLPDARQALLALAYECEAERWAERAGMALALGEHRAWRVYSHEASICRQTARRIRARLAGLPATPEHSTDCPLTNCVTCQTLPPSKLVIVSTADLVGRHASLGESIQQVARWLRYELACYWWRTPQGELQQMALWLIQLRDQVESGRWRP